MNSPDPFAPQFVRTESTSQASSDQLRRQRHESVVLCAMLLLFVCAWLGVSAVIVGTEWIEPPARGVLFRLCLLATPFALAAAVCAPVVFFQRRDRARAVEIQRADAMREPRI